MRGTVCVSVCALIRLILWWKCESDQKFRLIILQFFLSRLHTHTDTRTPTRHTYARIRVGRSFEGLNLESNGNKMILLRFSQFLFLIHFIKSKSIQSNWFIEMFYFYISSDHFCIERSKRWTWTKKNTNVYTYYVLRNTGASAWRGKITKSLKIKKAQKSISTKSITK